MFLDRSMLDVRPFVSALCLLLVGFIATFLYKGYKARMRFVELKRLGMPMPPHSLFWGHLKMFGELLIDMPADCHGHVHALEIKKAYPDLPDYFYVDLWPFSNQMLMVLEPTLASQFCEKPSLPKFDGLSEYMEPLTGKKDLLTMEGQEWKRWRGIYNPGFAASHLMTIVPGIVEDTLVFCEVLQRYARAGGIFKLEELITRLTVDIIGRVIMDIRMDAQRTTNDMLAGFRSQVKWLPTGQDRNPLKIYNPMRPVMYWYNTRRMNRWLSKELDARLSSRIELGQAAKLKRSKPVIDLALDTYLAEQGEKPSAGMDPNFKTIAMSMIKLFLFAGHDTTSSTLCYMYYLLQKHPSAQAKLTAELNTVFGTDTTKTAALITENPQLLNKLSYTTAVTKEALRLFPPASTLRQGEPGFFLHPTSDSGLQLPTDGFVIWAIHHAIHRNPSLWPQASEFLPERWLVPEGDPLYPVKGAYRPFEFGPRNCIGQEVAMLETKIIMALTVREFAVQPAYAEFDRSMGRDGMTLNGERAYQILLGSAKPADAMPCRVRMRV